MTPSLVHGRDRSTTDGNRVMYGPDHWPMSAADAEHVDRSVFGGLVDRVLSILGLEGQGVSRAETRWILGAFVMVAVGFVLALFLMSSVRLTGDEGFYAKNARAIAGVLTGGRPVAGLAHDVVDAGWFMPGMSVLLVPVYLVNPDASVVAIRVYAAMATFALLVWTVRECRVAFGRAGAVALLVMPGLAAIWLLFATTLWGDAVGGLLVAVVCARTFRLATGTVGDGPPRLRDVILLEMVMLAMVYVRSNTIVVAVAVHVLLLALVLLSGRARLRRVGILAAGLATFTALLAPWSFAASRTLDGTVVTTTSAPLSLALTFGEPDVLCEGPCPGRNPWHAALRYARGIAAERGVSVLTVQTEMAERALRDLTPSRYTAQVVDNFGRFVNPAGPGPRGSVGFVDRFLHHSPRVEGNDAVATLGSAIRRITMAVYVPFLAALVAANAAVVWRSRRLQLLSLCVKLFTVSLFLQPFLHQSHSRYWIGYAPLMAIAATFLWQWWCLARNSPGRLGMNRERVPLGRLESLDRALLVLQSAYVLAVAAIASMILML